MALKENDLHWVEVKLGKAEYERPGIILRLLPMGKVRVAVTSTKWNTHFNDKLDFPLYSDHKDFPATGLPEDSFVKYTFMEIDESKITENPIGRLGGELLEDFRKWVDDLEGN